MGPAWKGAFIYRVPSAFAKAGCYHYPRPACGHLRCLLNRGQSRSGLNSEGSSEIVRFSGGWRGARRCISSTPVTSMHSARNTPRGPSPAPQAAAARGLKRSEYLQGCRDYLPLLISAPRPTPPRRLDPYPESTLPRILDTAPPPFARLTSAAFFSAISSFSWASLTASEYFSTSSSVPFSFFSRPCFSSSSYGVGAGGRKKKAAGSQEMLCLGHCCPPAKLNRVGAEERRARPGLRATLGDGRGRPRASLAFPKGTQGPPAQDPGGEVC